MWLNINILEDCAASTPTRFILNTVWYWWNSGEYRALYELQAVFGLLGSRADQRGCKNLRFCLLYGCLYLYCIWSWAFTVTKFSEVFSGYRPCQVSVWNWCFEDHLSHRHQIPRNVGFIQAPDTADSPRRLHQTFTVIFPFGLLFLQVFQRNCLIISHRMSCLTLLIMLGVCDCSQGTRPVVGSDLIEFKTM